jgi:hypothetical protein
MHAEWKKLRRPVTVGFLLGLLLSGCLAYLAPASETLHVASPSGN